MLVPSLFQVVPSRALASLTWRMLKILEADLLVMAMDFKAGAELIAADLLYYGRAPYVEFFLLTCHGRV